MGDRSSVNYCELQVNDLNKFMEHVISEKVACHPDEKYLWDSIELKNNEIYLDWDDWKIHSYWYDSFQLFCLKLREIGLRGCISLIFIDGYEYIIHFNEDNIKVTFHPKCENGTDFYIRKEGLVDVTKKKNI